jgi:hypothetical protein
MLEKQGGYLDTVGNAKAAWTTRDIYYIQLTENTLGILRPGDRQALARWTSGSSTASMSPYLESALKTSSDAPILFAMDLTNAVGPGAVQYAYAMGKLPSLEKMGDGRDQLLVALGSVKGLSLRMKVDKQINSELTVDFDQNVDALGAGAKPFVIDVLNATGLYDPQVEKWDFKATGKTITGNGVSEPSAIGRLVAIVSPGDLGGNEAAPRQPANPGKSESVTSAEKAPQGSPAAASQSYYRAICKIFDQMSAKSSPTQSATWLHAQSRVIQQLPALGVDPMLLEWGDQTTSAFNRAAQTLAIGQQNAQVAAAGVASPTASGNNSYGSQGGSTSDTPESRAAFRNMQEQRRQVAQQQRAVAADQALAILNEAMATRGKIRTLMVQKYNVEF